MKRKLIEFSTDNLPEYKKWTKLYNLIKPICNSFQRLGGVFCRDDQLKIACMCEPPWYFLKHGCMIPHPYGITLSVDELGADCQIHQNTTIGSDARNMMLGEATSGHKPKIGNLVRIYPGAVVSGNIQISDCVIIAANAFINKDVPSYSFVYGINKIIPMTEDQKKLLKDSFWHCINIYPIIPCLVYINGDVYIDQTWAEQRMELFKNLFKNL